MREIRFTVEGKPVPQGSKRAFAHRTTGKPVLVDDNAKALREWRRAVKKVAELHASSWLRQAPLEVRLLFMIGPAPKHKTDGDWAPVVPDIDKLTRAALDGLTDGKVLVDDAQVVRLYVEKRYGGPGMRVVIRDTAHVYHAPDRSGTGARS